MNANELSTFINSPENLDVNTLPKIIELAMHYPYCQTGQLLLAKNLYNNGNPDYTRYINKAASYAGSRKKLYALVNALSKSSENPEIIDRSQIQNKISEISKPIAENKPAESIIKPETTIVEEQKTINKLEDRKPDVSAITISDADKKNEYQKQLRLRLAEIAQESKNKSSLTSATKENHNELIDKFIKEEPRLAPQNSEIKNEEDLSKKSSMDDSEIISETLAQIYEKQRNFEKAIKTYEKLSLKFPEKNTYFASQIENIKKNNQY